MNASLPRLFAPHRLCAVAAVLLAVVIGLLIPMAGDVKLLSLGIAIAGLVGAGCFLVLPNRRIALVCAWAFVFPLSLEKVFPLFKPAYPGFLIAPVVVSGADLIFYLLTITMFLEAAVQGRKVFHWSAALTPYALLVAWVGVTFFIDWPTSEGVMQIIHWVKMFLFLVVFSSAIRTREELLAVLVTLASAVLVQSGIVIAAYVLKRHLGFSPKAAEAALLSIPSGGEIITRATGTVGHSNQQAMYQALFTVPLVALFMVRNWIWRIVAALVLLISFCAIILTFSRTSWISCTLAAGVILLIAWRHHRITRAGWLGLCLGALVVVTTAGAFSGLIITRLTKADDGASLSRVHLALLALEHISNHPIKGVGPGNFINAKVATSGPVEWAYNVWLPRNTEYKPHFIGNMEIGQIELNNQWYYSSLPAHNKYLLVAAEMGLVGLALFVWFQWRLFRTALQGLKARDPLLWWTGVILAGTFAVTLNEFTFELFYDDKTVLMPLFVNALMICLARIATSQNEGAVA
ncbi:MAG TPA: O-antigen ligase family protein [Opitutaceae bacterium]|nr:O-antigen ligase family protein [Opitutaceae bacterium]